MFAPRSLSTRVVCGEQETGRSSRDRTGGANRKLELACEAVVCVEGRERSPHSIIATMIQKERNTRFYKTRYVTGRQVGPPSISEWRMFRSGKTRRRDLFQVLTYEGMCQAHGRQMMEQQEKFRPRFHCMVCLHDDCGKPC
jgi:hypothetical protein